MDFFLQCLRSGPVFGIGIGDEDGGRGLDHELAFGQANLLRCGQNFERPTGVVDLGMRNKRQTGKASERNPFCDLHFRDLH